MKLLPAIFISAALGPSLLCQSPQSPPPASCSLSVRILDFSGARLSSGFVLVHDEWAKVTREVPVNEHGEASTQLPRGLYDLFVASKLFLPVARLVNLRPCKPVEIEVKLLMDPDHPEMQVIGPVVVPDRPAPQ